MKRIPEPELMDDEAQAGAYARADFAEPHDMFVRLLRETWPVLEGHGRVLDLGCGPCDVTGRFCAAYPDCEVDAVDGAAAMLHLAPGKLAEHGCVERVRLVHAVLPDDPLPDTAYAAVISNSLLHHLRNPGVLWQTISDFVRSGAPVFVMDLMRPSSLEQVERLVDQYAAGEPEVLRHDFYHSLCAAYRVTEVEEQLHRFGLDSLTVRAVSDRHLVVYGIRE